MKPVEPPSDRLGTLAAFVALLLLDLVSRAAGFARLHSLIERFPRIGPARGDTAEIASICARVDRAAVYYFRRAWCLQRSATAVCLLRLRGVEAELVIGVSRQPFYAHAWVEVDGRVVNDDPAVRRRYAVLERC
jgi:hypothetical protein